LFEIQSFASIWVGKELKSMRQPPRTKAISNRSLLSGRRQRQIYYDKRKSLDNLASYWRGENDERLSQKKNSPYQTMRDLLLILLLIAPLFNAPLLSAEATTLCTMVRFTASHDFGDNSDMPAPPKSWSVTMKHLPVAIQAAIEPGIKLAANKWGVTLPQGLTYKFDRKKRWFGNRHLASTKNYENHIHHFWNFCACLKDYESMLILLDPEMRKVPSMNVNTVELFLRYKRTEAGEVLDDIYGKEVKDFFNEAVLADGKWVNPANEMGFCAAIGNVHEARGLGGDYSEECPRCCYHSLTPNTDCDKHLKMRRGNPCKSEVYKNARKRCNDSNYEPNRCMQLKPHQLRRIRQYLLSSNDLCSLELWTMCLLGCKLFSRSDEIVNFTIEGIVLERLIYKDGRVEAILIKFTGKVEKGKYVTRWLWADHECPEFCPVRHLLIYLFLTKHKGGYLFPTEKEIDNPPRDGIYRTSYSYATFRRKVIEVVNKCLTEEEKKNSLRVGLHMFRRTAYLLAMWGHGNWDLIMKSARHKSGTEATKYAGAALSELFYYRTNFPNKAEHRVSEWKCIDFECPQEDLQKNPFRPSSTETFIHLSEEFITNGLGLPQGHATRRDQIGLLSLAVNQQPFQGAHQRLDNWILKFSSYLPEGSVLCLQKTLQDCIDHEVLRVREELTEQYKTWTAKRELPVTTSEEQNRETKRRRIEQSNAGKNELEGYLSVGKIPSVKEKVEMMKELRKKYKVTTELTSAAKSFVCKTMEPILRCLNNHHNGNIVAFCKAWGAGKLPDGKQKRSFVMKFAESCCKGGEQDQCGCGLEKIQKAKKSKS
jgi:hypothetical protein